MATESFTITFSITCCFHRLKRCQITLIHEEIVCERYLGVYSPDTLFLDSSSLFLPFSPLKKERERWKREGMRRKKQERYHGRSHQASQTLIFLSFLCLAATTSSPAVPRSYLLQLAFGPISFKKTKERDVGQAS